MLQPRERCRRSDGKPYYCGRDQQSDDRARGARLQSRGLANAVGTMIESYDLLCYGTAVALVFNKRFFPNLGPMAGTLAPLASYAVGFGARPLGGMIAGHFGDRIGRAAMLMLTMIIMGAGTFLIGCLPTCQRVGIWAPILLVRLRLLQGVGIGGEWGGAVLMVLQHSEKGRRGFLDGLVQMGFPASMVLATLALRAVSKTAESDFLAPGWLFPFLVSVVLVLIGLFVRLRLAETRPFRELPARNGTVRRPVLTCSRRTGSRS
jgi:MFS transporter, MHS family, shikimate and dehydroshikimate transport protein